MDSHNDGQEPAAVQAPAPRSLPDWRRLPDWARAPFQRFLDYRDEEARLITLTLRAVTRLSRSADLFDAIETIRQHADLPREPDADRVDEQNRQDIQLANEEMARDFPLLHAHTLVALWSALEVLVEDILVAWLANSPDLRRGHRIARARVPFGAFDSLDNESRFRALADVLQQDARAEQRIGLGALSATLEPVGLTPVVEDDIRRAILEMQQLRHCIVHRGSRADQRLIEQCPWLQYKPNDAIRVSTEDLARYVRAANECVMAVARSILNKLKDTQPDSAAPTPPPP